MVLVLFYENARQTRLQTISKYLLVWASNFLFIFVKAERLVVKISSYPLLLLCSGDPRCAVVHKVG